MNRILSLVALLALTGIAQAQVAPVLTYAISTTSPDGKTLVPTLTWSTTPAATSCTASGDWTGTKLPAGTETQPAVSAAKAYTLTCGWPGDTTATVSWVAPTTNVDGTALAKCASQTDTSMCLRSFLVLRGTDATSVGSDSRAVNDFNATSYAWTGLAAGAQWFSVVAVNGAGIMSSQATPPVSKTITASSSVARTVTLGFSVPAAPVIQSVK